MIQRGTFSPASFLKNAHLQTLWSRIFSSHSRISYTNERLELPDGDFLDLAWTEQADNTNKPIIILFHGLEGSINSPYAQGMMRKLKENGWIAVLMHFRGCSGEHNRLQRSYHSGDTEDIRFCINELNARYPDNPLFTIAYSLGGNALLKYLAEEKKKTPLQAACAISVPFQLNLGADRLDQGFSKFYQWYLIRSLRLKLQHKFQTKTASFNPGDSSNYKNFWYFDDRITAPLHGFKSAEEYYRLSSCRQYLKGIEIPTLLIHSRDDPFLPEQAIPQNEELSETIRFELSEHGGHVGFVSGENPFRPVYWLEQRVPEFIHDQLTAIS